MDPITVAAVTLLAKQLAKQGLEKAFDASVEEVSKNTVNWLTNLFKKGGKANQELQELQEKPDSPARLNAVKSVIERELEDNPEAEKHLQEIYNKVLNVTSNISNSKNVNTGTINSDGNVQIGDNYGR